MDHVLTKTKLVFFPLLVLAASFITVYCFLYWLLWIKLDVIPLKEDIVHIWIPIALAFLCIFLFIRPRVHLLKLDKNNGKIRTLYYMVGAAVFCVPTLILVDFLDSSTGKLTPLDTITAIKQKPVTKYYKPSSFVLHKSFIGVEPVMSYSGKHNQHLNFDIYIALPFTGDLYDTLQSPAAFLMVQYHRQVSGKVSDAERKAQWASFWDESFEKFDKEPLYFKYLERIANSEKREHLTIAARKSTLYHTGAPVVILKPINEPFENRNGNKLKYASLSLSIGLVLWLLMIMIPGLHVSKTKKLATTKKRYFQKEVKEAVELFRPKAGFTATPLLVSVNTLVFIIMVLSGLGFVTFYTRDLLSWGAMYKPLMEQGQWWRLLTSMFLHGGIMHLFMNMVSLFITGLFIENTIGTKRFLTGYIITGIAAALVSLWWHNQPVVAVGASGAIFGLYGILLSLLIAKVFDAAFNKMMLILLACTAGYGLLMGFLTAGVDNSAHVGGLIAGFFIGLIYTRQIMKRESNPEAYH